MFIKQIIIQGFKSYKDQTVIEPFSPGTNVIVGRNGSGKSNFFAAIRFVLSDAYTQMGREERQALLHEGSGSAVMSAYVEIIFDNSDDRFLTKNPEVVIRRTIGLKKDEYSQDRKVTTKAEIMQLLETAGFSKSNPYYIVPQGRVTALTNMRESERLNLLKEIAGTNTYEARRSESLKIMGETNNKREKIDELLIYIKDRLDELEEEKEELRGFQEKDRERRCLEYAYYHQQQEAINEHLEEIDRIRNEGAEGSSSQREAFQIGEKEISTMERKLHDFQQQLELLRIDRRQLEEDRRDNARSRAKAELTAKNLEQTQEAVEYARRQQSSALQQIRDQIRANESELAKITPDYDKRRSEEVKIKQQMDTAEAARMRLLTKQTRSSQFRNKAERDAYLKNEINDLNLKLGSNKANRMDADEEVRRVEAGIQKMEADIAALRETLEGGAGNRSALVAEVETAQEKLDELKEEFKLLRREDDKLSTLLANTASERDHTEKELSKTMNSATSRGLATIRRLKREGDIPGAYGTLAELMDVDEPFRVAVEQVAGASLFHYVVDNEKTATILSDALYKQHGGRLTFMPLEQLRPKNVNFPRASDAVPILHKVRYDPIYEKAFQQVFGGTIIVPNLKIGGQYSRSHNMNCITPDGDTTNKRGAMTGGHVDSRRSVLEAVRNVSTWRDKYDELRSRQFELHTQMEQKEQAVTTAAGELTQAERRLHQGVNNIEPLRASLRNATAHLERMIAHLDSARKRRDDVDKIMTDDGETLAAREIELKSDFKKALSAEEERQLAELGEQVQQLRLIWNEASRKRLELEGRKQRLEVELRQNLRPQEDQFSSQAFEDASTAGGSASLDDARRELKKAQKSAAAIQSRLQENEQKIDEVVNEIKEVEAQKAQKEEEQQELAHQIERHQKKLEKSAQKKALYTHEAQECAKNIRELGVLPEEAFGKYERMDSKQITIRLKKVNEALKKFKHVNKKAVEQYNSFTNQQDQLMKRRKELDTSQKSIEELIAHLDQAKDEAIERTFKQVSKEFATIFERLVPAGHGRLVIQRRTDRRQQNAEESDEEQRGTVENYTGVGISVSFNSKVLDEQQKIQQLSGGQKSLCALCLIFAIQATEVSPMVIFDEVDANLDAQYRTAVAGLLDSISKEAGTQFICTTFRPEIVMVADKCYGVTFRNKTSTIDCVPAEEALNFVDGQKR